MSKPKFARWAAIAALVAGSCFGAVAAPQPEAPPVSYGVEADTFHPVREQQGMVASVDAAATRVGVDILKQGGNAVDAAVAVGYALAVTHPQAGNLGGGGFMLLRTKDGATTAIDFREMAPAQASRDMFLDDQGNPDSKKSLTSHLAAYRAVERTPISGDYRGYQVFSMPPPSSGGIHIVQILNILENFDLAKYGFGSADAMQVMAEAEKYAYADRSEYLGDPDFVKVPWQALTNKEYAKSIAQQIDVNKAKPSSQIRPGKLEPYESNQTTHFSVVDKEGNAVAVTYTLNTVFGTGIVAGNTGILLNNEMDDFSAKPGVPNVYGLVGGDANAVGANKRPLSSMSPTIVVKDGKTWLVTGSPGGSRIITTVLQMVVNSIDFKMNVAEATNAPRFHHQWLPDELRVEKGFSPDTLKILEQKGQKVALKEAMGSTQSIMVGEDGALYGASDPRSVDDLTAGY
ncbi:gamma-glutamyltransferase [Pseudescherichia vulneris]|uniref:gamma-glutamyltransferase n=1 Tax=Pseudescherichia vulneris TaxID=566 RepID=UPI0012ABB40B|nr:gamma-glutamyltransferase [Pseudescherichia vulneris]